jgi:hypothetical protein
MHGAWSCSIAAASAHHALHNACLDSPTARAQALQCGCVASCYSTSTLPAMLGGTATPRAARRASARKLWDMSRSALHRSSCTLRRRGAQQQSRSTGQASLVEINTCWSGTHPDQRRIRARRRAHLQADGCDGAADVLIGRREQQRRRGEALQAGRDGLLHGSAAGRAAAGSRGPASAGGYGSGGMPCRV